MGEELAVGDECTYYPNRDATEQMFGVTPDDYNGDPCFIRSIPAGNVALVRFEGDASVYRVHTNALQKVKSAPAQKPAPKAKPAKKEEDEGDEA